MLRTTLISLTSALAIATAQGALAQSGSPEASTGTGTEVGSQGVAIEYETSSPAASTDPAADTMSINMNMDTFRALSNARGEPVLTQEGNLIGIINSVDVNAQGNPELVVGIRDRSVIDADNLIITVTSGTITTTNTGFLLDTTLEELKLKAGASGIRDSVNRVDVTIN